MENMEKHIVLCIVHNGTFGWQETISRTFFRPGSGATEQGTEKTTAVEEVLWEKG